MRILEVLKYVLNGLSKAISYICIFLGILNVVYLWYMFPNLMYALIIIWIGFTIGAAVGGINHE